MATITCGDGNFQFEDPTGVNHIVSTDETFTFDLEDGGGQKVAYFQNVDTSVVTTDGRRITFRRQTDISNSPRKWGPNADAQDGLTIYGLSGEFVSEFSEGNIFQFWKADTLNTDNVDNPTSITGVWSDQFGRIMKWDSLSVA